MAPELEPRSPVVDAHQHFWDPRDARYPVLERPEMEPIRRPYLPDDLRPVLAESGVDATVLVNTRPDPGETAAFLETATLVDYVKGVVGWIDLADPLVADAWALLRARPESAMLVGLRHDLHAEPDPEWLLRPAVRRGLALVRDGGFALDLGAGRRELPACLRTARDFPDLRIVLDHTAEPPAASPDGIDAWAAALEPLAREPNVWCKLVAGLALPAGPGRSWDPAGLRPYVERIVERFGEDRVVFGSGWPVCLLAGSYAQVRAALEAALGGGLSDAARAKILGGNAIDVYRLVVSPDPLAATPGGGGVHPGVPT